MCGPSGQQKQTTDEQANFYSNLTNQYNQVFGQNQAITGALTNAYSGMVAKGAGQTGMTPAEETSLRTAADTGVATDYAQAQRATGQTLAAMGGGNTYIPSSVTANIMASTANQAAQARSAANLGITQQNYALGRQNYWNALGGMQNVGQLLSPTSYATVATGAGSAASGSEQAMAQQAWAPWQALLGGATAVGGQALAAYIGK